LLTTSTMKVKRKVLEDAFRELVDDMYEARRDAV
jgi:hypothetical protein